MDASFKGSKPYTFCLQSAIYSNESYPLELSIYPSESQQLYSAFVQFGKIIGIQEEEWKEKVLLSDMGGSLISFAKEYLHDYYFCQRHIIELFGPCSGLYTFVRKILRYALFEEYEFKRHLIIQQVKFYKKKRDMCNPKINTIFEQKYKTLLKMLNSDETSRNSKWHYSRSATWTRKEFHVATCSNHCEDLHSCLKKRNENNTTFLTKISNLMKKIIHHVINIPVNSGNSLKQKMQNRKSYVVSKLRGFKGSYKFFTNDSCQCKKVEFLTQLYRTRIQCKNQVLYPCLSQIEKMELKDNVVNDIIIQTLEGDISNKQQIRNQLLSKYQFLQPAKTELEILIDQIFGCFIQMPNKPLAFDEDFSFKHLYITKSSTKIELPRYPKEGDNNNNNNNNKKAPSHSNKQPKSDDEMWLCDITDDVIKKATKLKYKTLREIHDVYPKSKENQVAYLLCDQKFREHFKFQDESVVNEGFVTYKINCWAEADRFMGSNKFFG